MRIVSGVLFLALAMVGLGSRLAFLHLGPHESLRNGASQRRRIEKTILAGRGKIYDRQGARNILALNQAVKHVCADPFALVSEEKVDDVAVCLARQLGEEPAEIAHTIRARCKKRFAYVKRFVAEDRAELIDRDKLPGVFFRDALVRNYPQGHFMCHVLGFVNYEGTGSAGVEQRVDSYLRGCPGLVQAPVDARRREMYARRESYVPAIQGANVYLTIDQNVQYIVEQALDDVVARYRPEGAWAIVEKVDTGEIIGMASRPCFDPNEFTSADPEALLNRAIGLVYEPGSTFKAATIAAALNEGTVTAGTVFDCENGRWRHVNRDLRDHHGYGPLTVADGLKKSSNILAAKVGLTLGRERFERCLRSFGFGSRLGIDVPGEETGILRPHGRWSAISASRISIGQGVAVTALQMLGVFCAIANDGFLMRPYVISHVLGANGAILLNSEPRVLGRPISRETAEAMRRLLRRVTEDGGTGTAARVKGCPVAGKTGTAQKPEPGGYSETRYIASFAGFAPANTPEIAVIVVVDEPKGARYYGGQVAAPAFSRIVGQVLRYLDVPPGQQRLAHAATRRRS